MSRRVSLPGADELFRTTGGMALQSSSPAARQANGEAAGARSGRARATGRRREDAPQSVPAQGGDGDGRRARGRGRGVRRPSPAAGRPPPRASTRDAAPPSRRRKVRPPGRRQPPAPQRAGAAPRPGANRRPSGRERHDEKITVYVSAEELMDLEHARLVLRGEHGLAVDRGRIVREAVAVVLADLESRGDASILVRRLRGR